MCFFIWFVFSTRSTWVLEADSIVDEPIDCVLVQEEHILIVECWFVNITANETGGALVISGDGSCHIRRCTFSNCKVNVTVPGDGGAFWIGVTKSILIERICSFNCSARFGGTGKFATPANVTMATVTSGVANEGGAFHGYDLIISETNGTNCNTYGIGQVLMANNSLISWNIMTNWLNSYSGALVSCAGATNCSHCTWQDASTGFPIDAWYVNTFCYWCFFSNVWPPDNMNNGGVVLTNCRLTDTSLGRKVSDGGGNILGVAPAAEITQILGSKDCYLADVWVPIETATESISKTPSPTATESRSQTPSPTESVSQTPSPTESVSQTPSPTESRSQTPSPTETVSQTPSPTESRSQTPSPTDSRSQTPSPTDSRSQTPSPTESRSQTPSPTDSRSQTPSPTESHSHTPSLTQTVSQTPSPTETVSHTPSPTESRSQTPSPTDSRSRTPSPTQTVSQTPSLTQTRSQTPSPTETRSQTPSPTESRSKTPSPTQTRSKTPSPTESRSKTPSPTQTQSKSPSGSATPIPSDPFTLAWNSRFRRQQVLRRVLEFTFMWMLEEE